MTNEIDVRRPREVLRILGTGNQKPSIRSQLRRHNQQYIERLLAIFRVGADVGKVSTIMRQRLRRPMQVRIDMTIERRNLSCAKALAQFIERSASAIAQDQIEIAKSRRADIGHAL